jgi:hypothetical protein
VITDKVVADLCRGIYAYPGDPPVAWEHLDLGDVDGVAWGLIRVDGVTIVVFRGSTTGLDWLLNFDCLANPFHHADIGPTSFGFLSGIENMLRELLAMLGADERVIVAGHSRGAAQADILTGLLVLAGRPPIARVVFGEPRPGFAQLAGIVAGVPGRSYLNGDENGHDRIHDVPFCLPPTLLYVHPTEPVRISAPPSPNDPWGPLFGYHHIWLYASATPAKPII